MNFEVFLSFGIRYSLFDIRYYYLYLMYLIKTPWWLRVLYPQLVWRFPGKEKVIYLTFDDGPHPVATLFALEQLKRYNAKASFFCIGKNVLEYPGIYDRILQEGHVAGNHTFNHVNGWKVSNEVYHDEIQKTAHLVKSNLFRPPYGRIKRSQIRQLKTSDQRLQTIMWDVLSADFDTRLTPEACLGYVLYHTKPGSIVLLHDSEKAWPRMQFILPRMLEHFTRQGYRFEKIPDAVPGG
jgi:peptidoglycan/xylan/chitin deacetylase (PgdA/CDA1 family)